MPESQGAPAPSGAEPAVDAATRAEAVAEAHRLVVQDGLSANEACAQVAAPLGVSGRSVGRWAARLGQPLGQVSRDAAKTRAASAALAARGGYTAVRRLALADRFLEAIEDQLDELPYDGLKELALAFAILSDKRDKLEDRASEQAALADPAYWAWLDGRHGGDILRRLGQPNPPYTSTPEHVTAARYHLVAGALGLPGQTEGAPPPAPPATRRRKGGTRSGATVAGMPAAAGRPQKGRSGTLTDGELAAQLQRLRNPRVPAAERMKVAAQLAEQGWGPAPDADELDP